MLHFDVQFRRYPFKVQFHNLQIITKTEADVYLGPYEAEPTFSDQRLATAGMMMANDVLVHAIAVNSAENEAGGNTVVIGGILDGYQV